MSDEYQQNKIKYRSIERSKELATRVASKKLMDEVSGLQLLLKIIPTLELAKP